MKTFWRSIAIGLVVSLILSRVSMGVVSFGFNAGRRIYGFPFSTMNYYSTPGIVESLPMIILNALAWGAGIYIVFWAVSKVRKRTHKKKRFFYSKN